MTVNLGCRVFFDDHGEGEGGCIANIQPLALAIVAPLKPIEMVVVQQYSVKVRKYKLTSLERAWSEPTTRVIVITTTSARGRTEQGSYHGEVAFRRHQLPSTETASLKEFAAMRVDPARGVLGAPFVEGFLRVCASSASASYGFVHCASSSLYLQAEARILSGNPEAPATIEHLGDRNDMVYPYRERIGAQIVGAHWGVFLGQNLLERLGGRDRVTAEAPVQIVRHLENGAAFLQLTSEPMNLSALEMRKRLPAFEAYLEPISVPIGPYFRKKISCEE